MIRWSFLQLEHVKEIYIMRPFLSLFENFHIVFIDPQLIWSYKKVTKLCFNMDLEYLVQYVVYICEEINILAVLF